MFHVMFDNAQSVDKKVAQFHGECGVVYAADSWPGDCMRVPICTDHLHINV